jgi:hypothetical protein
MRAFLLACAAYILVGAGAYFSLNMLQESSGDAYTQETARIDPGANWRLVTTTLPAQTCKPRTVSQWFFVDFGDPAGESPACSDLQ